MKKPGRRSASARTLRPMAEASLRKAEKGAGVPKRTKAELQALIRELKIRQVELEKQNEQLRGIEAELMETRENEEKYRTLVERANDGIIIVQDGIVVFANEKMGELDGSSVEQIVGTPFTAHVHPGSLPTLVENYRRRMAGESVPSLYETVLIRHNGDPVPSELNAGAITYQGRPADLVIIRDNTARTRAAEDLAASEKMWRTLFETMNEGVFYQRADGLLVDVNAAALRMFGLSRDEFLSRTSMHSEWDVIREDGTPLPGTEHPSMLALRTGKPVYDFVVGIRNPQTKTYTWVSASGIPEFHEGDSRPYQVVVTMHDLTERKRVEEALRKREELLNDVGRIAQIGGWEMDLLTRKATWTRATYDIVGIKPGDPIPGPDEHVRYYVEEDRPIVEEAMRALIEDDQPLDFEARVDVAGRRIKWFRALGRAVRVNGKCVRLLGTLQDVTERKRAEESLRAAHDLNQSTLDALSAHIAILDSDGTILAVNRAWAEFAGRNELKTSDACVGANYLEICDGAEGEGSEIARDAAQGIREVAKGMLSRFVYEYPCHGPEENRWFVMRVTRLLGGGPGRVVVAHENITERKHAEEALRKSEGLFRKVFEVLPVGLWIADKDGKLVSANPAGVKIWGGSPFVDQAKYGVFKARRLPSGEEIAPHDWALAHTVKEGITVTNELLEIDALDGVTRTILNYTAPVLSDRGVVEAAIVVNLDITQRQEAVNRLRESEEKLRAQAGFLETLLNTIPNPVFYKGMDGRYTGMNKACEEFLGRKACDVIGKTVFDLAPKEVAEGYHQADEELYRNPGRQHYEWIVIPKGAERRSVVFDKATIHDAGGKVVGLVGIISDVTERKRAEDEIRTLALHQEQIREKERSDIAREIHDNLAQLLTAMRMDVSWIEKHVVFDEKSGQKLRGLGELLDMGVVAVQKVSMALRPGILDDLGLVAAARWQAGEYQKRAGHATQVAADPEEIETSPEKATALFRILQEALTNVARHAGASRVDVKLVQTADAIRMEICDDGKGITAGDAARPTAFGLIGIRERVKSLGGTAEFIGKPGEGTTVRVTIPR